MRDIIAHLKICPNHPPTALAEARLAAWLLEDREALNVPPLLKQKVYALKPLLKKRVEPVWVWGLRLAVAVAAIGIVIWGLVARPTPEPPVLSAEPAQFEEVFFSSGVLPDETLNLWVEASNTMLK